MSLSQESLAVNYSQEEYLFRNFESRWRSMGWVRYIETSFQPEFDRTRLIIYLTTGQQLGHSFSRHEMAMGGLDALRYWLEHLERDIRHYFELSYQNYANQYQQMLGSYGLNNQLGNYIVQQAGNYQQGLQSQYNQIAQQQMLGQIYAQMQDQVQMQAMYGWRISRAGFTDEADKKARELFKKTVGEEEYEILDKGNPLPIMGSKGTAYHLFAKASFCIERIKDKARLCAVVPGVPLWDHLLGIKLMIEHDEPAFLKTANVSGGQRESRWNRFREMFA